MLGHIASRLTVYVWFEAPSLYDWYDCTVVRWNVGSWFGCWFSVTAFRFIDFLLWVQLHWPTSDWFFIACGSVVQTLRAPVDWQFEFGVRRTRVQSVQLLCIVFSYRLHARLSVCLFWMSIVESLCMCVSMAVLMSVCLALICILLNVLLLCYAICASVIFCTHLLVALSMCLGFAFFTIRHVY